MASGIRDAKESSPHAAAAAHDKEAMVAVMAVMVHSSAVRNVALCRGWKILLRVWSVEEGEVPGIDANAGKPRRDETG